MSIIRNITPAVAVMVAGLAGAYLVYENFFTAQNGAEYAAISPAAGESTEDAIIIAEAGAPVTEATVEVETTPVAETTEVSTDGTVTQTETDIVTTTTEVAPAPVPAPNCDTLQTAATAAMGTAGIEKAQKDLSECLAAQEAAKAAPKAVEVKTETKVETDAHTAEFTKADKDGDGKLSRDEAVAANPNVADEFSKIDTNGDGFITPEEDKAMLDAAKNAVKETVTETAPVATEAAPAAIEAAPTTTEATPATEESHEGHAH